MKIDIPVITEAEQVEIAARYVFSHPVEKAIELAGIKIHACPIIPNNLALIGDPSNPKNAQFIRITP